MNQPSNSGIRVLVVDDELPARKRLRELLRKRSDVEAVAEAENGVEAVSFIEKDRPDLVFLDVQMPRVDGFGVIEAIGPEKMPATIFVTAYDRFAVTAFDADAADYLLKPFGDERFEQAMAKAKAILQQASPQILGPRILQLAEKRAAPGELWDWLVVKSGGVTQLVMADSIDWIEAAGVYVNLHTQGKEFIYRAALGTIVDRLDPFRFVRIHRSRVANISSIVHLEPRSHGEFEVLMKDGVRLALSRHYRADVEKRLGQSL